MRHRDRRSGPARRATTPTARAPAPASTLEQGPQPTARLRIITAGSLLVGLVLWILSGNDLPPLQWGVVLAAIGLGLLPPVTRSMARLLDWLRHPSTRAAEWTALLVGVISAAYLIATAFLQERPLAPRMLDESSYAISTQILAHGRLWMEQHPLADFFDSFFLVVRPKYSSIYFPGTGLAFAPGVWFSWPSWILPVVFTGVSISLVYRIVTILTDDGAAGLLAAIWMLSLMPVRALSVMMMSQTVMLLLGLLIVWAWLRWRDRPRWGWAAVIGALCGWAAITRPVDALAFAAPIGIAMAAGLRGHRIREWAVTALSLVVAAAPFLALQIIHNAGITGNPLRTPYTDYLEREQPGAQYGIRTYDPSWRPASNAPQTIAYYNWCRPFLEHHQPGNFLEPWFKTHELRPGHPTPPRLLAVPDNTLPAHALLLFLPAGLMALASQRRRIVILGILVLFFVLYVFNPFFLPHYLVVVTPLIIVLTLWGVQCVSQAAGGSWAPRVRVGAATAIVAMSVISLWEVRSLMSPGGKPQPDGFQESAPQSFVESSLDLVVQRPAVVLFGQPPDQWTEMAYNTDVAWPDDAPIIRAHDLGSRNSEIIDYYGQRQPERTFYQFDWRRGSLKRLGEAGALRAQLRSGMPIERIMAGQ